jgi:transposase
VRAISSSASRLPSLISIRAYLAEFGIVAPVGRRGVEQLLEVVADKADRRLPEVARVCLAALGVSCVYRRLRYWSSTAASSFGIDQMRRANGWTRSLVSVRRWQRLWSPALLIRWPSDRDDTSQAWAGLVPKQNSSGGKDKLGSISKQGDGF